MLEYLFGLLPVAVQRLIRPEVEDLITGFDRLERKLGSVQSRHAGNHAYLVQLQAEIASEIDDTKAEIERAARIAKRIRALVD